jgi:hypothetical protein
VIYVQQAIPGSNEPAIIYGEGLVALSGKVFLTTVIQTADHESIERRVSSRPRAGASAPDANPPAGVPHTAPDHASP